MKKSLNLEYLRFKFSMTAMINIAIIMLLVIVGYNIYLWNSNSTKAGKFISHIVENEGYYDPHPAHPPKEHFNDFSPEFPPNSSQNPPPPPEREMQQGNFSIALPPHNEKQKGFERNLNEDAVYSDSFKDYCSVLIDSNGTTYEFLRNFTFPSEDFTQGFLVYKALSYENANKKLPHSFHGYTFTFAPHPNGILLVILDCKSDFIQQRNFGIVSILIFSLCLLLSYGISWIISLSAMQPIYESIQNQRRFIADASHELKTPIAVIGANIDVLQSEYPNNKWISYIKTENKRMSSLVKDLLYLAKNDAGRAEFQMLPFDMIESLKAAVLPFESVALEQEKNLEIKLPDSMLPVCGDEAKIKQLVIILVDNAFKNTSKGDLIRIEAGKKDSQFCFVKVYNTGHGIEQKDIDKIFDRFYRSDYSRARSTGGYGLGLAIAKTIAQAHKGHINVTGKVDEFAEFTFEFPGLYKVNRR